MFDARGGTFKGFRSEVDKHLRNEDRGCNVSKVKLIERIATSIGMILMVGIMLVGPGGVVAGLEYPFGAGEYSDNGQFCNRVQAVGKDFNHWQKTTADASRVQGELEGDASAAPNSRARAVFSRVSSDMTNMLTATALGDSGSFDAAFLQFQSDAKTMNSWYSDTCKSAAMTIPRGLNNIWSGFFGGWN